MVENWLEVILTILLIILHSLGILLILPKLKGAYPKAFEVLTSKKKWLFQPERVYILISYLIILILNLMIFATFQMDISPMWKWNISFFGLLFLSQFTIRFFIRLFWAPFYNEISKGLKSIDNK